MDLKAGILQVDPKAGSRSDKPMIVPWPCQTARLWAGGGLFLEQTLGNFGKCDVMRCRQFDPAKWGARSMSRANMGNPIWWMGDSD